MRRAICGAVLLLAASMPASGQDLDTRTGGFVGAFDTQASEIKTDGRLSNSGQVFRPVNATETQLDGFSFFNNNYTDLFSGGNPGDFQYRAYISEYDPITGRLVGGILYTSGITVSPNTIGFQEQSFDTGGLLLDPTKYYLAFMSAAGLPNPNPGEITDMGHERITESAYTDGFAVASLTTGAPTTSDLWTQYTVSDLAFTADFSVPGSQTATPEPATLTLLGTGLAAIVVARRRKRSQEA